MPPKTPGFWKAAWRHRVASRRGTPRSTGPPGCTSGPRRSPAGTRAAPRSRRGSRSPPPAPSNRPTSWPCRSPHRCRTAAAARAPNPAAHRPRPRTPCRRASQPSPSAPNTSGWPSRLRIPAAGRTAIGSWRLRPIFCRPWKRFDAQLLPRAPPLRSHSSVSSRRSARRQPARACRIRWCRPLRGARAIPAGALR